MRTASRMAYPDAILGKLSGTCRRNLDKRPKTYQMHYISKVEKMKVGVFTEKYSFLRDVFMQNNGFFKCRQKFYVTYSIVSVAVI